MMLKMTGVSSALMMVNGASIVYRSGKSYFDAPSHIGCMTK
jgi:hypothetical protein